MKNRLAKVLGVSPKGGRQAWLAARITRVCWLVLLVVTGGCSHHVTDESADGCRHSTPLLKLVWPPNGVGAAPGLGVWCGDVALEASIYRAEFHTEGHVFDADLGLGMGAPSGLRARKSGQRCVRLRLGEQVPVDGGALLHPAGALRDESGETVGCLEAGPVQQGVAPRPPETLSCDGEWQQAGFGCALVNDGQLVIETPPQPLLWVIHDKHGQLDELVAATEWDALVISLNGAGSLSLMLENIDLEGRHYLHSLNL